MECSYAVCVAMTCGCSKVSATDRPELSDNDVTICDVWNYLHLAVECQPSAIDTCTNADDKVLYANNSFARQ